MTVPDPKTLSAYVDGELDPPEAARVARLIATDERVARDAARLFEMKEAVAALAPDVVLVHVAAARPRNFLPHAVAAGLLALVLGGLLWAIGSMGGAGDRAALLAEAGLRHDAWLGAEDGEPKPVAADPGLFAPELGAAGLSLVKTEQDVEIAGRRATHAGYAGTRGCRLSLFEMAAGESLPDVLTLGKTDRHLWASWEIGSERFLAVARNMDETRFATIAGVLRSMTASRQPAGEDVVAQLDGARQPCRA